MQYAEGGTEPILTGCPTRAEALAAAAGACAALACAPLAALADEAGEADDGPGFDEEAYSGVAEDIAYYGSGLGYVAPYALPSTSYAAQAAAAPKRVLVVVDYQVDFVDGGVFGTSGPAVAIAEALCQKIEAYQDRGDVVIYTMDTHPADLYDLTREATVNPPHCDPDTLGWQVYGRARELLTPQRGAVMVKKGTYGSFEVARIIEGLRSQGTAVESIELAGVSTTCRVLHNAVILYNAFPELPLIMDERTTASYTDERTAEQLEELEAWGFIVRRA